jgi:hypothetical protein
MLDLITSTEHTSRIKPYFTKADVPFSHAANDKQTMVQLRWCLQDAHEVLSNQFHTAGARGISDAILPAGSSRQQLKV